METLYNGNDVIEKLTDEVIAITQPFFRASGVNYFSYTRFYQDNSFASLFTDKRVMQTCLQHSDFYPQAYQLPTGLHMWTNFMPRTLLQKLQQEYNYFSGFSILTKNNLYREQYSFCIDSKDNQPSKFYFSNLGTLQDFIFYFKDQANKLIQIADSNRFNLTEEQLKKAVDTPMNNEFTMDLDTRHFHIIGRTGPVSLTRREMQCYLQICRFKTLKEIAQRLDISNRTAIFHTNNLYKKLGCNRRSQLFNIAVENGIII